MTRFSALFALLSIISIQAVAQNQFWVSDTEIERNGHVIYQNKYASSVEKKPDEYINRIGRYEIQSVEAKFDDGKFQIYVKERYTNVCSDGNTSFKFRVFHRDQPLELKQVFKRAENSNYRDTYLGEYLGIRGERPKSYPQASSYLIFSDRGTYYWNSPGFNAEQLYYTPNDYRQVGKNRTYTTRILSVDIDNLDISIDPMDISVQFEKIHLEDWRTDQNQEINAQSKQYFFNCVENLHGIKLKTKYQIDRDYEARQKTENRNSLPNINLEDYVIKYDYEKARAQAITDNKLLMVVVENANGSLLGRFNDVRVNRLTNYYFTLLIEKPTDEFAQKYRSEITGTPFLFIIRPSDEAVLGYDILPSDQQFLGVVPTWVNIIKTEGYFSWD